MGATLETVHQTHGEIRTSSGDKEKQRKNSGNVWAQIFVYYIGEMTKQNLKHGFSEYLCSTMKVTHSHFLPILLV